MKHGLPEMTTHLDLFGLSDDTESLHVTSLLLDVLGGVLKWQVLLKVAWNDQRFASPRWTVNHLKRGVNFSNGSVS